MFYRPPGPVFLLPERRILIVAERFVDKPICSSVDLEHGLKSRGSVPFPTLPLLPLPFISHPYLWSFPTFSPYPTFPGISSFSRYGVWRIYTRRQCNVMLVSDPSPRTNSYILLYPPCNTNARLFGQVESDGPWHELRTSLAKFLASFGPP